MTAIATPVRAPRLAPRVSPAQGIRQSFSLAWRTLVSIKHNPVSTTLKEAVSLSALSVARWGM